MADSSTTRPRANLTLRLEGIAPHDELLFKSLVRLLSYRTQHNWAFGTGSVDLQIIGEESLEAAASSKAAANVLWVGHLPAGRSPFLQLPLHANELELLLNTLGAQILKRQQSLARSSPSEFAPDEMLTLTRWPPSSLLGSAARIKLATLMTAHTLSLEMLAQRSGASLEECRRFSQELDRAGILQRSAQPSAPQTLALKAKPDLSLLARIRRRLGI